MLRSTELPLNEYGAIDTSASFGYSVIIEVTYNTDPEGKWVDDSNYENRLRFVAVAEWSVQGHG